MQEFYNKGKGKEKKENKTNQPTNNQPSLQGNFQLSWP